MLMPPSSNKPVKLYCVRQLRIAVVLMPYSLSPEGLRLVPEACTRLPSYPLIYVMVEASV